MLREVEVREDVRRRALEVAALLANCTQGTEANRSDLAHRIANLFAPRFYEYVYRVVQEEAAGGQPKKPLRAF